MNIYKGTFELVDISLSDEEATLERRYKPLPRYEVPNFRVVLEIPQSPAEDTVGEEEYFDLTLESLESDCKRMKLSLSFESIESGELSETEEMSEALHHQEPPDSPESLDESLRSEMFVVDTHASGRVCVE